MRGLLLITALSAVAACGPRPVEDVSTDAASAIETLHVVQAPPLRVYGDEPARTVDRRAEDLARVARRLDEDLFDEAPSPDLEVWLFRDAESTRHHTRQILGRDPDPPEGFYSVADHAIVVDVSPGEHAPVHYLVHAYVHANFPQCPVWFDEGLAAMYEGAVDTLAENAALPTLRELTDLDQAGFHGAGRAVHRAMSRRGCQWLQYQGLLRAYSDPLRANHGPDPGG